MIRKNKRMKIQKFSNYNFSPKSRKAAMEMSIGTLVTIVLLMAVMILGVILIRSIFTSSGDYITEIDSEVQNEIDKLFADGSKGIVMVPSSRSIRIPQGESGGIGLSIRNTDNAEGDFTYEVTFGEKNQGCQITDPMSLIILGKESRNPITIPSGNQMENPVLIKFDITESDPLCKLRYDVNVKKNGQQYKSTTSFDLEILPS